MLLAIGLLIPAMPMAAVAAGHTTITQGIAGYVTTGEAPGTPVVGATVTVWTTAAEPVVVATATSVAEGFYEVQVPAGNYYVQFEGEGYFSQFYDGVTDLADATVVTVVEGEIDFVELWGQDRYGTAIAVSQRSHPSPAGADVVVIARGDLFPDALAGASIAGLYNAPILLTRPDAIPAAVVAEINRLSPSEIYILGNTHAVSASVRAQLAALPGVTNVERFGGPTRYETAVEIAEHVIGELGDAYDGTAFVATGGRFPDALAASPIMAAQGIPMFLAHPTTGLSAHTKAAMAAAVTDAAFIVGGPLAVSNDVEDDLEDMFGAANVERVDGPNRYATAVAVAEFAVDEYAHVWEGVGIATGQRFPDALTGGPYQGQIGSVMLLTHISSLTPVTANTLTTHNPHICERVHIYGGPLAVSPAVRTAIQAIITPCPEIVWVDAVLVPILVGEPVLMLEKEADADFFVEVGDVITYTYTLSNTGNVMLDAPFTVEDNMIDGTIDVVAMDLAVGADVSVTATYAVTADDVLAGVVTNTATAQGFYDDAAVVSVATQVSVELAAPEIMLVKEADIEFFSEVDEEITFTFTLTNTGNVALTGPFTIDDPMVMVEADDPELMLLAPGEWTTFTGTYTVTAGNLEEGSIVNVATAGALFGDVEITSVEAEATIVFAALVLQKEADVEIFTEAGDQIVYTYTLTNMGGVELDGPFTVNDDMVDPVLVGDPLDPDVLIPGASYTYTATYTVDADDVDAGFVTNVAYAEGFYDGRMVVVSPAAQVTVPLAAPEIMLAKASDITTFTAAGDEIVYTYTLTNTGNVPLTGPFTVEDDKIDGTIDVVAMDLAVGADVSVTATYAVTADDVEAGFVTNTATAQGFYGDTTVVSAPVTVTVCITLADRLAADGRFTTLLAAAEIAGLDGALADPLFGPVTLFAPTDDAFAALEAQLGPVEWAALLADPDALADVLLYHLLYGEFFSTDVVVGIEDADPDPFVVDTALEGAYVSFSATVAGVFINDAEIFEFDIGACNGVIHVIDAVLVPAPALQLEKVASTEATVTVGDEIIYTYTLTNTGSWTLDDPFTVVDSVIGTFTVDPMMWTELAVGASIEVTASYMVTIDDLIAGSVTNEAYAVGWFAGMEVMSATDTVSIPVEAEAGAVVVQHVFPHPHHHMTIDARGTLEETPTVDLLEDEADVCVQFLNTGDVAVDVDVVIHLDTTLDAQWWYWDGIEWRDAIADGGFSLTLDSHVLEEICFYVYFENEPGNYGPFDATFNVYAAGTMDLLAWTMFEVNLSAPGE